MEATKKQTRYAVQLWCPDCKGEPVAGCGNGRPWILRDELGRPRRFGTLAEANAIGCEATRDGIWRFRVIIYKREDER